MGSEVISIDDKMLNPARSYQSPAHVLLDVTLSHREKGEVLESWRLDAERLAESSNEGMAGGEQSRLREVAMAQQQLAALVSD